MSSVIKKIITVFGLFILFCVEIDAQWIIKNQKIFFAEPKSYSLCSLNKNEIWLLGQLGAVTYLYSTTNGGNTWLSKILPYDKNYRNVFFLNDKMGWVCGQDGVIIRTTDGGVSWEKQNETVGETLYNIKFINANIGIANGFSTVYCTSDGGKNWLPKKLGANVINAYDIFMCDENLFYVGANINGVRPVLGKTTDGGKNWSVLEYGFSNFYFKKIHFRDAKNGIAFYWCDSCLTTTDGGITWTSKGRIEQLYKNSDFIRTVYMDSNSVIWVLTEKEEVLKSEDYGSSWILIKGPNANLSGIINFPAGFIIEDGNGFYISKNSFCTTSDGGVTFQQKPDGIKENFVSIGFADSIHGMAISTQVYLTSDRGTTWVMTDQSVSHPTPGEIFGVSKSSYIVGANSYNPYSFPSLTNQIYRSSDFGHTWYPSSSPISACYNSLNFITDSVGILGGSRFINGTYFAKTTNAGITWEKINSNLGEFDFKRICFPDDKHGWVIGSEGIKKTDDGGIFWSSCSISGYTAFDGGYFFNERDGIVFDKTNLFKTTNGGNSWIITKITEGYEEIKNVIFYNNDIGYILTSSQLLRTINKGITWKSVDNFPITGGVLNNMAILPNGNVMVCGMNGIIAEYDAGGINVDDITKPNNSAGKEKLLQNYPNPFNACTSINYSIETNTHVRISLFDILGRKISTLVNEIKRAGNYSVVFDASHLSSGVYFYTLNTSNFRQTKKMIITK